MHALTFNVPGLVYKKGKFSATEESQLHAAIERYQTVSRHEHLSSWRPSLNSSQARGLTEGKLADLMFSKEKGRDAFWSEISEYMHHMRTSNILNML